jgi:lipoate-protein ligase B
MHPANDLSPGDSTATALLVRRLGRRSYADACALQERAAATVQRGGADELLYVEHAPVITLGRGAAPEQLLASAAELAAVGITLVETDRGGGATFHGPGQLVGYPVIDLRRRGIGVRAYLRALEGALVAVLRGADIDAFVRPGLTGAWTRRGKIVAIGVAVRRGITRHGFALNVYNDLSGFDRIVPCGLNEPVTSLQELGWTGDAESLRLGTAVALDRALTAAARPHGFAAIGRRAAWSAPAYGARA